MKQPSRDQTRKEMLLHVGVRVFAAKGYHATTVEDVIQATDISRATFYAYFKSKEDLFTAIVDQLLEGQSAFILELQAKFLSHSFDFSNALEEIIHTIERVARTNRDELEVFLNVVQGSGTRAEKHFHQIQQVTLDHFTDLIQRQMESLGYPAVTARSLAYLLIGGMMYVGKAGLYGEMSNRDISQFLQGIKGLLPTPPKADAPDAPAKPRRPTRRRP
jgi:AcrR family transcriptional regulator